MFCMGPGRKSAIAAVTSSKLWGFISSSIRRMPEPSSWNTPWVSAFDSSS